MFEPQMITLIANAILALFFIVGFLWGLGRGSTKSIIRFIYFIVFVVIAVIASPYVTKLLLSIEIPMLEGNINNFILEQINTLLASQPEIQAFYDSNLALQNLVLQLPALLINLIVFLLLILLGKFFSWIGYIITYKIHFKNKNKKQHVVMGDKIYTLKDGKPVEITQAPEPKKHRIIGGLISSVQALILLFIIFIPISGIIDTARQYIDPALTANNSVYAETEPQKTYIPTENFEYTEISSLLNEYVPPEAFDYIGAYANSITAKMFNLGNINLLCFDTLTSIKVEDKKVVLRNELNTIANVTEGTLYITKIIEQMQTDDSFTFKTLNFNKIEKSIDSVFDSGLIATVGMETLSYFMDKVENNEIALETGYDEVITDVLKPISDNLKGITDDTETVPDKSQQNKNMLETLKSDFKAIFGIAKAMCESGIIDELVKTPVTLTIKDAYSMLVTQEKDYINEMVESILSSSSLKTATIAFANYGIKQSATELGKILTEQDGFDSLANTASLWNAVGDNLSFVIKDAFDVYIFVEKYTTGPDKLTFATFKDFQTLLTDDKFKETYDKVASILNTLTVDNAFIKTTVNGHNLLSQLYNTLNKIKKLNCYADFTKLEGLNFVDEFNLFYNFIEFANPILQDKNFDYKTYEFSAKENEQYVLNYDLLADNLSRLFDSKIAQALKTKFIADKIEIDPAKQEANLLTKIKNLLYSKDDDPETQDTEFISQLKPIISPYFNVVSELGKAGAIEFFITISDKTPVERITVVKKINTMVENLIPLETPDPATIKEDAPIYTIIDELFSTDITRIMVTEGLNYAFSLLNDRVVEDGTPVTIGEIDKRKDWNGWSEIVAEDSKLFIDNLYRIYRNVGINALDDLTVDDFVEKIPYSLLEKNFDSTDTNIGSAEALGNILDILNNSALFEYGTDEKSIIKDIITKYETVINKFINVDAALKGNETFYQRELKNIAPAIDILVNTKSDTTDTTSILEVLIQRTATNISDIKGLLGLDSDQKDTLLNSLYNSVLLENFVVETTDNLNRALIKKINSTIQDEDIVPITPIPRDDPEQTENIVKNIVKIVKTALEIANTEIDFDDLWKEDTELSTTRTLLGDLLSELKINKDLSGVFSQTYTELNTLLVIGINDVKTEIAEMLNDYISLTEHPINDNIKPEEYDVSDEFTEISNVLIKFKAIQDKGITDLEEIKTNLISTLEENQSEAFADVYSALLALNLSDI